MIALIVEKTDGVVDMEAGGGVTRIVSDDSVSSVGTIDAVTAAVVRSAMETICFEMATYVSRTATTPILNQSNERNATILTGDGRLLRCRWASAVQASSTRR
jgi:hypothetical protein